MAGTWTVEVGYTSSRPVRPDEHWTRVTVAAADHMEAVTVAAQMVGTQVGAWMDRPHVEMVTSTLIVDWPERG